MSEKKVFVGDCLFLGSIGRTDLPGGNHEQLIESINTQILSLEDDFIVYSGHGPETTVGRERTSNPFLTGIYNIGRGKFV
jgi:glyoxylase-like metal-dependent hydrolase (beta-lactamase superfamily II)